jgi:hypothetical protein
VGAFDGKRQLLVFGALNALPLQRLIAPPASALVFDVLKMWTDVRIETFENYICEKIFAARNCSASA